MRRRIGSLKMGINESFYDYWCRFQSMLTKCPQYQITYHDLIQYFVSGLRPQDKIIVNASCGGSILNKLPTEAFRILAEMANENRDESAQGTRTVPDTGKSMHLKVKLERILDQMEKVMNHTGAPNKRVCGVCKSVTHFTDECPTLWKRNDAHQPDLPPPPPRAREEPSLAELVHAMTKENVKSQQENERFKQETRAGLQYVNAVTTKSEEEVMKAEMKGDTEGITKEEKQTQEEVAEPTRQETKKKPPFSERLAHDKKDEEMKELLKVFQKVEINIPPLDAIKTVHQEVLEKMPKKCEDPGMFVIPCIIGSKKIENAMLDLSASINVMPITIYEELNLGQLKETRVIIQLADRSNVYPEGLIEDVLVKVGELIFPADFYVLDIGKMTPSTSVLLITALSGGFQFADNDADRHDASIGADGTKENRLLRLLRIYKEAVGWTLADIKGISPAVCMHRIFLKDDAKPKVAAAKAKSQTLKRKKQLLPTLSEDEEAEEEKAESSGDSRAHTSQDDQSPSLKEAVEGTTDVPSVSAKEKGKAAAKPFAKKGKTVVSLTSGKVMQKGEDILPTREIVHSKTIHFASLAVLGIEREVRELFSNIGWSFFIEWDCLIFPKLVYEFFYDLSVKSMGKGDLNDDEYKSAIVVVPTDENVEEKWAELGDGSKFKSETRKGYMLQSSALCFCHRVLAYKFFGRKDSSNSITNQELFVLWCMVHEKRINFGAVAIAHFKDTVAHSKNRISSAQLITHLAEKLHLFDPSSTNLTKQEAPDGTSGRASNHHHHCQTRPIGDRPVCLLQARRI
ncbi:hypothetical protein C2S51_007079 [Perilla frutescens var. frutescens]|nr:hypothetical protein C2S51_007079 [Perilla frutescens var. frutescens]